MLGTQCYRTLSSHLSMISVPAPPHSLRLVPPRPRWRQPQAPSSRPPFIGVRVDADRNKVLLDIPSGRLNQDFLHQSTLATGFGSLGLDRGQTGGSVVVRLERHGKRIVMMRDNWSVRAPGASAAEQRAASEGFARSVIASFPIESEANNVIVADATTFFLSDTYGIGETIRRVAAGHAAARRRAQLGRRRAYEGVSAEHARFIPCSHSPSTIPARAFVEVRRIRPRSPWKCITRWCSCRDSAGFRARQGDPRSGVNGPQFYDFSQGYQGTYRDAIAGRWRLVPKDPAAYQRGELTEPVTPIVYYLDPGIPAEYREALREGGMWWNKIFEAAGFRNAFACAIFRPAPT